MRARGGWSAATLALLGVAMPWAPRPAAAAAGVSLPTLKAPVIGLVDRSTLAVPPSSPPPAVPGITAYVVNVTWAQLQPENPVTVPGAPFDTSAIDQAIMDVDGMASGGVRPRLVLRLFAGADAPAWAMALGGPTMQLVDSFSPTGPSRPVGRYWTGDPANAKTYAGAYAALQQRLALRYDTVPEIAEVVAARCAAFYPEPLIKDLSVAADMQALEQAGFTEGQDQACQQQSLDAMQGWQQSRVALTLNPYQYIDMSNPSQPVARVDEPYTERMMAGCVSTLGPRCVLENDSLRSTATQFPQTAEYARMYQAMLDWAQTGALTAYQTAVEAPQNRVGDLWGALVQAARLRALHVELPPGYTSPPPPQQSEPWQQLTQVAAWFMGPPTLTMHVAPATEGSAATLNGLLTLDESAATDTSGGYGADGSVPFDTVSASIDWGAGAELATVGGATSATCPSAPPSCTLAVSGGHLFADEGTATAVNVAVSEVGATVPPNASAPGALVTQSATASVSDAPLKTTGTGALTARHRSRWSGTVADVTDGYVQAPQSDLTATVSWGDGSALTAAALVARSGGYWVQASHVWRRTGTFTVTVFVRDGGGSSSSTSEPVTVR